MADDLLDNRARDRWRRRAACPKIDAVTDTAIRKALKNYDAGIRKIATRFSVGGRNRTADTELPPDSSRRDADCRFLRRRKPIDVLQAYARDTPR